METKSIHVAEIIDERTSAMLRSPVTLRYSSRENTKRKHKNNPTTKSAAFRALQHARSQTTHTAERTANHFLGGVVFLERPVLCAGVDDQSLGCCRSCLHPLAPRRHVRVGRHLQRVVGLVENFQAPAHGLVVGRESASVARGVTD